MRLVVLGSSSRLDLGGFSGSGGTDQPIVIAQRCRLHRRRADRHLARAAAGPTSGREDCSRRRRWHGFIVFNQEFAAGSTTNSDLSFYTRSRAPGCGVQSGKWHDTLQPTSRGKHIYRGYRPINQGPLQVAAAMVLACREQNHDQRERTLNLNSFGGSAGCSTLSKEDRFRAGGAAFAPTSPP